MSLPWIPIYLDAYTGDTMHLTCEEHGAYFQMMLAYYRSEKPLPASDRSLAAIVKLPMERWIEAKPALAAFFREQDGLWHHDRIEKELASRADKHAKSIATARAGAAAMHLKKGHKPASSTAASTATAVRKQNSSRKTAVSKASAVQSAVPEQCSNDAHLHIHPSITEGEEAARAEVNLGGEESIGQPIDPAFRPRVDLLDICTSDGASAAQIEHEIAVFIASKQDDGAFSHDWQAAWWKWWLRWRERKAKQEPMKAKPRVEVSTRFEPTADQWREVAERFARNASHWSRQCGPEPGSRNCRCPREILIAAGIDPETGLTTAKEKV